MAVGENQGENTRGRLNQRGWMNIPSFRHESRVTSGEGGTFNAAAWRITSPKKTPAREE